MRTIEYVTHASLKFKCDDVTLLTDPFYWFDPLLGSVMMHFPPRPLEVADVGHVDFLYSSHIHPDHSHPDTLRRLRGQIDTVLLPADRPGLEQRFRGVGFDDVRLLANGQTMTISPGLQVTSYWSDAIDTCLVVQMGDRTAVHFNDCLPTMELASLLGTRYTIDYAFMLYTSAQDLYPFLLPRTPEQLAELAQQREAAFLAEQIERVRRLRPRVVVPYSMTMTWYQPEQRALNGLSRLLPQQFSAAVRAACPEVRAEVVQPGDVLDVERGELSRRNHVDHWGPDLATYVANIAQVAAAEARPAFDKGLVAGVSDRLRHHLEAFVKRPPPAGVAPLYQFLRRGIQVTIEGEDGEISWFVDLLSRRIGSSGWAVVEVTVPASIVALMLDGFYDPYSLLFLHRTRFRLNSLAVVSPEVESAVYLMTFMLLLCENPFDFVVPESVNSLQL